MAVLQPNATYEMNGVTVREKIIPDGTKWKDGAKANAAGFAAGNLYKKQTKLSSNSGKVKYVTIHNTDDIKGTNDDAEQYTRATYNENMGSARVHFYIDDVGAWQNLKAGTGLCKADPVGSAEVGWHAGDGSADTGGNMTSIGIEVIMNDTAAHDAKAKDNGARVAAWLLFKHGLTVDKLVTHTYWVNHALGYKFADPDIQSTNMIFGKKWCPQYIFASTSETVALANWKKFKTLVSGYLDALNGKKASGGTNTPETLYRVQVGAYGVKKNAETMLAKLKAAGFAGIILQSGKLYRVQVGAYGVKKNADAMLKRLKAAGFSGFIQKV